jgi:hypothetical protein
VQKLGRIRLGEGRKIEDVAFEAKQQRLDVLLIQDLDEPKDIRTQKAGSGFWLVTAGRVGVLLNQKMWERLEKKEICRGCDRMLAVTVAGTVFVSAYQPCTVGDGQAQPEVERFFEKRQRFAARFSRGTRPPQQIWGGDWNSHLSWCGAEVEEFGAGFLGDFRLNNRPPKKDPFKENVVFARTNYLCIADSFMPVHKRGTFLKEQRAGARAPPEWTELDYFFVSKPLLQSVSKIESRFVGVVTDHKMKLMVIRLKPTRAMTRVARARRAREKAERAQKVEVRLLWRSKRAAADYKAKTEEVYLREKSACGHAERADAAAADPDALKEHMHEKYDLLEQAMQSAGAEVLGFIESGRGAWVTPAEREEHRSRLEDLMRRRREAGEQVNNAAAKRQLQGDIDAERKRWRELQKVKEKEWTEAKAIEACDAFREGDVGLQYRCLNELNDAHEKKNDSSTEHRFEVADVTAHFKAVGNDPPVLPDKFWEVLEELVPSLPMDASLAEEPSDEEQMMVMKEKIRSNAAVGRDVLHIQQLKYSAPCVQKDFFELIRFLWKTRAAQKEEFNLIKQIILWKKKEPRSDLNKYRAISLVTLVSKFLETLAATRLLKWIEKTGWLGKSQFAYREDLSTDDLNLLLQLAIEHAEIQCEEHDVEGRATLLAVDQKKAFPSTVRRAVWEVMRKLGAPEAFIELLQEIHDDARFYVLYGGESGESYQNQRGFREGGSSSPVLFLIAINLLLLLVERDGRGLDFVYDPTFTAPLNTRAKKRDCTATGKLGAGMFADDLTMAQRARHLEENEQLATDNACIAGHALHPDETERLEIRKQGHAPAPDPAGRPGYWSEEIKVVGGMRRAGHIATAKAESESRRLKAEGQWAKWKRLMLDEDGLHGRATDLEAGRLVEVNVYSVLCYNVCRLIPDATLDEYERFTNRVVRELLDVDLDDLYEGGPMNQADLRLRCGLKNIRIYIERRQLQYLNRVLHRGDTCPVKKLLWARFPGKSGATPTTCKMFHDLAVRAVGLDYLEKDAKQFAESAEKYLEMRHKELDVDASKGGGGERRKFSHRHRRPRLDMVARREDREEEMSKYEEGTLGYPATLKVCPQCKVRMLVLDRLQSPTQKHDRSWRRHQEHCAQVFVPAQFDEARMKKCLCRFWECRKCGWRALTQATMWDHVQTCA